MGATSNAAQSEIVTAAVKSISHIATLPEITLKIIELVEDPTSTAQDLHNVISNDPALCSRILKVVNSAFYGLPRQIGSINRAIVLLGLNAVKNIAIAASLSKLFRGGDLCQHFSARNLWIHSIATATASKVLCDQLRLGLPDEAFLAGLMHDLGIMVEMQAHRNELIDAFEQLELDRDGLPARDMREIERSLIGADHCAFGAALCDLWKFPKAFAYVTGYHHNPLELPEGSRMLSCIVYVADRMAAKMDYGFRADLQSLEPDPAVLEALGIGSEQLERIMAGLPKAYEDVEATFSAG
jgi:HD-like signal output (HDOD) protein